ncbi:unnamed protein product [Leptidea sinapis]|uniref:Uncharacterized protein n=1 Tax=Leptidea sinapis TaxID=189913 RepID=A0A5E4PPL2_9NEOP|nr:unnamed protein product [Leptidea sinapis]
MISMSFMVNRTKQMSLEAFNELTNHSGNASDQNTYILYKQGKNRTFYSNQQPTTCKYKDTLCEYGLQCALPSHQEVIREAVVGERRDASNLGHAWVRAGRRVSGLAAFVLETHISDHHAVGVSVDLTASDNTKTDIVSCSHEVISDRLVKEKLDGYDWEHLLTISCPILLYKTLCSAVTSIYHETGENIEIEETIEAISEEVHREEENNIELPSTSQKPHDLLFSTSSQQPNDQLPSTSSQQPNDELPPRHRLHIPRRRQTRVHAEEPPEWKIDVKNLTRKQFTRHYEA